MLPFSLSFLLAATQLLWLPSVQLYWILFIPVVLVLLLILIKVGISKSLINSVVLGLCLGFSMAITTAYFAKSTQLQTIPDDTIIVIGRIDSLPQLSEMGPRGDKVKFSFEVNQSESELPFKKLLVSWYNAAQKPQVGQEFEFMLKLKPIHGLKNPGSFDYVKWLFRHGYDATATVKTAVLVSENINNNYTIASNFSRFINQKRAQVAELIDRHFESIRVRALIRALTIGDKSLIDHKDTQLFQDTGIAHLIAISGLHIGLIAFIGILIGRVFFYLVANEKINQFKFEAIFAIIFAIAYALLAGLSIPTIRALVMVSVFSISYALNLSVSRWQAWSIALLLVLIIDPLSVLDIGFWFSFSAVAILMFVFTGRKKTSSKILTFVKAQMVILIGLMPIMAIVFQQINFLSPFVNFIVLPFASLLLIPLIFASMMAYVLSETMAEFLFAIVNKLTEILFVIIDYMQKFNYFKINIYQPDSLTIIAIVVLVFVLLLPKLFRWRLLSLFLCLPLIIQKDKTMETDEFHIDVLDVGQGLSVMVRTSNHVMIYDTGAKYDSGFSMASAVVIPYLQNQGINSLDKLVLSHDDNDHSGGASELKDSFDNMEVLTVTDQYSSCQYPNTWNWDGVTFSVLSPFELFPYLGNNSSCVIRVASKNGSIILTGDIEEAVEYRLVKNLPDKLKSDVMLVPHHGSRTSSDENFLDNIKPQVAINSSGFANQFNHPHPKIKKLYQDKDIKFYDTQESGMVSVKFINSGYEITTYVDTNKRLWNPKLL